jgi:prepilin-type N-terminal cleavage/methylation domain-containing protein
MRARGLTLLEVIIALAVFAVGAVAALSLYSNSLKAAKQAKNENIISLLEREIRVRCQLAALRAYAGEPPVSTFDGSDWLLRDPAAPDDPGTPVLLDGGGGGGSSDADALNGQRWEIVRERFDDAGGDGSRWDDQPLYTNWQFRLRTVLPSEVESNQFVDLDGYDVWDSRSKELSPNIMADEIGHDPTGAGKPPHAAVKPPASARATAPPGAVNAGNFGAPRSSHGVTYDPRGMRFHVKRVKCVIGWDLNNRSDIFSGERHEFYFTIYNPDLQK